MRRRHDTRYLQALHGHMQQLRAHLAYRPTALDMMAAIQRCSWLDTVQQRVITRYHVVAALTYGSRV